VRIKTFPKYTKLLITWKDIISDPSWHDREAVEKAQSVRINTLGFFLQNKKKDLKIAHSVTDDGDSDYTIIPWACIDSVDSL